MTPFCCKPAAEQKTLGQCPTATPVFQKPQHLPLAMVCSQSMIKQGSAAWAQILGAHQHQVLLGPHLVGQLCKQNRQEEGRWASSILPPVHGSTPLLLRAMPSGPSVKVNAKGEQLLQNLHFPTMV